MLLRFLHNRMRTSSDLTFLLLLRDPRLCSKLHFKSHCPFNTASLTLPYAFPENCAPPHPQPAVYTMASSSELKPFFGLRDKFEKQPGLGSPGPANHRLRMAGALGTDVSGEMPRGQNHQWGRVLRV